MSALLIALALAGWILLTWAELRVCQRVRRTQRGLLRCELWHRTYLDSPTPDAFPQPREARIVAWRLAGLPLWTLRSVIALPLEMDARIGHIAPDTFDRHFCGRFALNGGAVPPAASGLPAVNDPIPCMFHPRQPARGRQAVT